MRNFLPATFTAFTSLFILSSCSSSSSDTRANPGSISGPVTLPFRIASIEIDLDNNDMIDVNQSLSYDANGRIINRTTRYPGTARPDTTNDYLYSGGNLVEIQNGNSVTSLTYNVESVNTQIISYNEQGLPASIESSTQPSSLFSPNYTSKINYEEQNCRVAYSANPLKLASTAAVANASFTSDDPALCLYPLDQGGFQ